MKKKVLAIISLGLCSPTYTFAEDVKPFVIVTVTPTGTFVDPKDNSHLEQVATAGLDQEIIDSLNNAEYLGTDTEQLIELVINSKTLDALPEDTKARLEAVISDWTKPIPASSIEKNIAGYTALSKIRPGSETYSAKRDKYKAIQDEKRKSVLQRFKTQLDEFNGITFYTHKNMPRYTDIRSYVELYIGKKEGQPPFLRLKINYTSKRWLFIDSAVANIDGQFTTIPVSDWQRDNDSEIWEWIDVVASGQYLEITKRISESNKTVIRFNGQQYFDDYTVRIEDKEAIRDALLAYEVLQQE